MKAFAKWIASNRVLVLIIAGILVIPALYGMQMTPINYDILTYLPKDLDSTKGQKILEDEYSNAASSMLIIEDMEPKDVIKLKEKIAKINGVDNVIWVDDLIDISIPEEILPDEVKSVFYSGNSTLVIIKYINSSSSDETMQAVTDIRKLMDKQCYLSGMSAIIKDTKDLSDKETPMYVLLAVILAVIVLSLTMNATLIPFIFLLEIGIAILYNFGTNIFFGKISYITKALAAVLQLGVTMDYSIFLLHRYEEERKNTKSKEEAMANAISNTIVSIAGSSLTTMAGFLALCVMSLTLGKDIGLVMAKGVFIGIIATITILPALILVLDNAIHRFSHKTILPEFKKTAALVTRNYKIFIILFVLLFIPAIYGQQRTQVYYTLDDSLPDDMESIIATRKLKDDYKMTTTYFIMVSDQIPGYQVKDITTKIENVDGINKVISLDKFIGPMIPREFIPQKVVDIFEQGGYKLIIANSQYKAARDETNAQIDELTSIVKDCDPQGLVAGEAVLTKDLIAIADQDFIRVSYASIISIFAIIMLLYASLSLPVLLVLSIELAIWINMSIPYYTGSTIPFIASIVIGCIQLGATVDYAILLSTRFREEIRNGYDKLNAMEIAVQGSARSIVTSGLTFFAATAGVGVISDISIVRVLCAMVARGALISMVVILFLLPSLLLVTEPVIAKTTKKWAKKPEIISTGKLTEER